MNAARRLGHVTFSTPDLSRQIDYYGAILGLDVLHRDQTRAILKTKQGQEAIALEQSGGAGLLGTSFEMAPGTDLAAIASALAEAGVSHDTRTDPTPGVSKSLVFTDPAGTRVELFADYRFAPPGPPNSVITPLKLGHVANRVTDVHKMVKFYTSLLDFKVSDWRMDVFAFLRCNPDHHTINFLTHGDAGLHHVAFELKDWGEIHRACDHVAKNGLSIEWGPARHVIGHNVACYHRNPDGLLIEMFCELDRIADEALGYFDPRPWHQDFPQRPRVWGPEWPRNYWNGEIAPWAANALKKAS